MLNDEISEIITELVVNSNTIIESTTNPFFKQEMKYINCKTFKALVKCLSHSQLNYSKLHN